MLGRFRGYFIRQKTRSFNSKDQFQKMLEFLRKHSTQKIVLGGHNIIQNVLRKHV
jgi:hypothetical protein